MPGAWEVLFSSSVLGVGAAIRIEVSAESEAVRVKAVAQLREALVGCHGVVIIRDNRFSAAREIALKPTEAATAYQLPVEQLARALSGVVVNDALILASVTTRSGRTTAHHTERPLLKRGNRDFVRCFRRR